MSSANVTYAPPARVGQAEAARAKKQKLLLAGGGLLLVVLVAVQVPRLFSSGEPAVAPPEVVLPVVPAPATATPAPAQSPEVKAQLERIQSQYIPKDPFAQRAIRGSSAGVSVRGAPAGSRDPFAQRSVGASDQPVRVASGGAVRDPFQPPAVAAPAPVQPAPAPQPPAPAPAQDRLEGYIIVLASVPVASGRRAAGDVAAAARARGVPGVGVVRSSDYPTLNPGYFAVYSQVFKTRAEAQRSVGQVRALGYPNSYVRPLGR